MWGTKKNHVFSLNIAGFKIRIKNSSGDALFIEDGYEPFLTPDNYSEPHLLLDAFSNIIEIDPLQKTVLYEAVLKGQLLWRINWYEDKYCFEIYDPRDQNKLQQVAIVNNSFDHWSVYMDPVTDTRGQQGICPLLYPLGPLLLYYLTVFNNAAMIHAAGIAYKNHGLLFTGFSGAGKSTITEIFRKKGAKVINDDRLIIRKTDKEYKIYNTPMFYQLNPQCAVLNKIFKIFHAETNCLKELKGVAAVSTVLAFCIQHGYKKEFVDSHLEFITGLCDSIQVFELGFVPDSSVFEFIDQELKL